MNPPNQPLTQLLLANPQLVAAWYDNPTLPANIIAINNGEIPTQALHKPNSLRDLPVQQRNGSPINILRTPVTRHVPQNQNQVCQDEPIQLGTQVQPQGANWLGTAGAAVSWTDAQNARHWGILSNYHVLADGDPRVGRTVHQPDIQSPACARLSAWSRPIPTEINHVDAAVADALIDGFHTIDERILALGIPGARTQTAIVALPVTKSGRTTAVTTGHCIAVGASVNVSYGQYTATFEDQDIFASDDQPFSAPGDSGSMILATPSLSPTALLFAGSQELTVGNPIRHVTRAMHLQWPFN